MASRFWQDPNIDKVFKETAKELGYTEEVVRDVIRNLFLQVKKELSSSNMNKVLLHNFGSWRITKRKIDSKIRQMIKNYKEERITKEELKNILKPLFKKRKDLCQK